MMQTARKRTWRRVFLFALWQIVGSLCLLTLIELGLRAWTPAPEEPPQESEDILQLDPLLGWRLKAGFDGPAFGAHRQIAADGIQMIDSDQARHGTGPRILILGDSRSFGNGVRPDQTYAEVLDSQLPGYDVINLAVPGYSSYQGLETLRQALPAYRPDIVIFAFGFNDRRSVLMAAIDGPETFSRNARRRSFNDAAQKLYLFRFLLSSGRSKDDGPSPVFIGDLQPRVSPEAYARNISSAADLARQEGARFLLLLMRDSPNQSHDLDIGYQLAQEGRWDLAQVHLTRAVEASNAFSDAARAMLWQKPAEMRMSSEANIPEPVVSVFGGRPLSPQGPYLAAAQAAAMQEGLEVVDAGPWLRENPDIFYDFCHFHSPGHDEIALHIQKRVLSRDKLPQDVGRDINNPE